MTPEDKRRAWYAGLAELFGYGAIPDMRRMAPSAATYAYRSARLAAHFGRLALQGQEEPSGCPTPGACSCIADEVA